MPVRAFNFNAIKTQKIGRTAFDLSHSVKGSFPMGKFIPLVLQECVPGDRFKVQVHQLSRLMALISPMFHDVDIHLDAFYQPSRLLMKDFDKFWTGGESGTEAPTVPQVNLGDIYDHNPDWLAPGSLLSYLGVPSPLSYDSSTGTWSFNDNIDNDSDHNSQLPNISLLPLNMYISIWNEYIRDETIQPKLPLFDESKVYTASEIASSLSNAGIDEDKFMTCYHRDWVKDYFTSAMPDPQRGNAVGVPFADTGDIKINNPELVVDNIQGHGGPLSVNDLNTGDEAAKMFATYSGVDSYITELTGEADISNLSTVSIIGLRTAFAIQKVLERLNVSGGRVQEATLALFNEWVPDERLQKPLRLSSSRCPIMISEVETNAETGGLVVGDLAGKAKSRGSFRPFKLKCVEFGYMMICVSIMPKPGYLQGLNRLWTRFDRWDMYNPYTQFIGEQSVKNQELYVDYSSLAISAVPDNWNFKDFGYQARFSDMKFNPDRIVGDMQTSLAHWHMARMFSKRPGLNNYFLECNPTDRVFAVQSDVSDQKVLGEFYIQMIASRKMSRFSTPKLLG